MYKHLPTTLVLLLGQLVAQTLGSASLVPPTVTLTNQTSTVTSPTTTGVSATITATNSGSSSTTQTSSSAANSTSTAQFPSLSGVPSCISTCLDTAISGVECSSVIDVNCFCVNPLFAPQLVACILANCPDQVSSSETLAQQFCNIATLSPSLSFPPVPTTTTLSTTTTSDTTTTTAPPTTSITSPASSATRLRIGYTSQEAVLGLIVGAVSLIFGAYFVQ